MLGLVLVLGAALSVAVFWPRPLAAPPALAALSLTNLSGEAAQLVQSNVVRVRLNPGSATAWGELGGILKSCGLPAGARVCLTEAERLDARDPRWPYLLGVLGGEDALPCLRRAAALTGKSPEMPRLKLARALIEAGEWQEAEAVASSVARDNAECFPARLLLAQIHQARGEWKQAIEQAAPCVNNPTTARAAGTLLAIAHRRAGDTAAAESAARQAEARPPDVSWPDPFEEEITALRSDPRNLSDRAQAHLLAGRPDAAGPLIKRLVQSHPSFAEGWLLLGRVQYLRKQPAEAELTFRRHLELDPASVNGHFQLGMSRLAQQKFAAATEAFRQAIALKNDFGPAWFNLGFALARLGQTREAVEPFRQAIRHNPEKVDSYILLADLHLQLGEANEAARLAELATQLDPNDRRLPTLRRKIGLP
jgi:tetratricopeptide (TPR) repeat protein